MAKINEVAENLFQAIDLLTSSKMNDLEFDKTLVCSIVSVINPIKGEYRVTDGASTFVAYSENIEYKEGAKVYVQVPQGDMGSQKIILGRYINTEEQDNFLYASPLDNFINATGNILSENYSSSLLANGPRREILLCELTDVYYKNFERLGLKAKFKSWLPQDASGGSYGLRLDIIGKNKMGTNVYNSLYLDASDMFGNPYNFGTDFVQEKLFNIENILEITGIRVVFYQAGNFVKKDGTVLSFQFPDGSVLYDNLFVSSPEILFGYSLDNIKEDTIILDTNDSLIYRNGDTPKERNIYMRWVHKNNLEFEAIDKEDEIPEAAKIHWYRYKLEQNRQDELAGYFWREIDDLKDYFNYTFVPEYEGSEDMFKVIVEFPSREYIAQQLTISNGEIANKKLELEKTLEPSAYNEIVGIIDVMCGLNDFELIKEEYNNFFEKNTLTEEEEKIYEEVLNIILSKKSTVAYYESKNLIFTNEIPRESDVLDLIQGLEIECDAAGFNGVYRLYDESNNIINSVESSRRRILQANYSSIVTGEESLDTAEEINWYFPIDNTMIQMPEEGIEYNSEEGDIFNPEGDDFLAMPGYYLIKRKGMEIAGKSEVEEGIQLIQSQQIFRIKNYYTQSASNNTIYCIIKKAGRTFQATKTLIFGTAGSNGTEASFNLKIYDAAGKYEVNRLVAKPGEAIIVKPELYDFNNKPVKIDNISYKWYSIEDDTVLETKFIDNNINCKISVLEDVSIEELEHLILEANINWRNPMKGTTAKLKTYLPIPVAVDATYKEIEGATKIVYDSNGANPKYYKEPYKLFLDNLVEVENVEWEISVSNEINNYEKFYPQIMSDNSLRPSVMFYQDLEPTCIRAIKNDNIVWSQPILIIQNRFFSTVIDGWNGDLVLDEKSGTILSAMVGAGRKNSDNSFSGVLMGEVEFNSQRDLGLFGFHEGIQSFGFKVDGTAFIGKPEHGRIEFDGNKGIIESSNFSDTGKTGMSIDLDDAFIKAYGSGGSFILSPTEYLLKSANGNVLFDLSDGIFNMSSGTGKNSISFNSAGTRNSPYFSIVINNSNLFKITKDDFFIRSSNGLLDLNFISGNITAKSGSIGSWSITSNTIESIPIDGNNDKKIILNANEGYISVGTPSKKAEAIFSTLDLSVKYEIPSGFAGGSISEGMSDFDDAVTDLMPEPEPPSDDENGGTENLSLNMLNSSANLSLFSTESPEEVAYKYTIKTLGGTSIYNFNVGFLNQEQHYFKVNYLGDLEAANSKILNGLFYNLSTVILQVKGAIYERKIMKVLTNIKFKPKRQKIYDYIIYLGHRTTDDIEYPVTIDKVEELT